MQYSTEIESWFLTQAFRFISAFDRFSSGYFFVPAIILIAAAFLIYRGLEKGSFKNLIVYMLYFIFMWQCLLKPVMSADKNFSMPLIASFANNGLEKLRAAVLGAESGEFTQKMKTAYKYYAAENLLTTKSDFKISVKEFFEKCMAAAIYKNEELNLSHPLDIDFDGECTKIKNDLKVKAAEYANYLLADDVRDNSFLAVKSSLENFLVAKEIKKRYNKWPAASEVLENLSVYERIGDLSKVHAYVLMVVTMLFVFVKLVAIVPFKWRVLLYWLEIFTVVKLWPIFWVPLIYVSVESVTVFKILAYCVAPVLMFVVIVGSTKGIQFFMDAMYDRK